MIKKAIALTLFLCLFISCSGEMVPVLKDLVRLRQEIQKKFEVKNVQIGIHNNHILTIGLVNSHYGRLDPDEKKIKAREIAVFAFTKIKKDFLDTVLVSYIIHKRYFLIFNYTNTLDSYRFKTSELSS